MANAMSDSQYALIVEKRAPGTAGLHRIWETDVVMGLGVGRRSGDDLPVNMCHEADGSTILVVTGLEVTTRSPRQIKGYRLDCRKKGVSMVRLTLSEQSCYPVYDIRFSVAVLDIHSKKMTIVKQASYPAYVKVTSRPEHAVPM